MDPKNSMKMLEAPSLVAGEGASGAAGAAAAAAGAAGQ
jgi:hypothetical protein